MQKSALSYAVLPALLATTLASCDKEVPPVAPMARIEAVNAAQQDHFYYHQGQPIPLLVDDSRIIVSTALSDILATARNALTGIDVEIIGSAGIGRGLPNHAVLAVRSRDVESAVARLRSDSRFSFASLAYVSMDHRDTLWPVNRIDVRFRDNVRQGQIDSLISAAGDTDI